MSNEGIVQLLLKLRSVVVPSCKNIGEQLTYSAYKEKLIDEILKKIQDNETAGSNATPELIKVDHQKIAHDVIKRTFDAHNQILRAKLQRCEAELKKWKELALTRIPNAYELFLNSSEGDRYHETYTQTEDIEVPFFQNDEPSVCSCLPLSEQLDRFSVLSSSWYSYQVKMFWTHSDLLVNCFYDSVRSMNFCSDSPKEKDVKPKGRKKIDPKNSSVPVLPSAQLSRRGYSYDHHNAAGSMKEYNREAVDDRQSQLYVIRPVALSERKIKKDVKR